MQVMKVKKGKQVPCTAQRYTTAINGWVINTERGVWSGLHCGVSVPEALVAIAINMIQVWHSYSAQSTAKHVKIVETWKKLTNELFHVADIKNWNYACENCQYRLYKILANVHTNQNSGS